MRRVLGEEEEGTTRLGRIEEVKDGDPIPCSLGGFPLVDWTRLTKCFRKSSS